MIHPCVNVFRQHGRQYGWECARLSGRVDAVRIPKESLHSYRVMQNPAPELQSLSMVAANYGLARRNLGAVSVLGPVRMDYPGAIIAEIVAGTAGAQNFQVEPDRGQAIRIAIAAARPGDLVVIAGKGHEDYQIIRDPAPGAGPKATVKIHFDDREVAREALGL